MRAALRSIAAVLAGLVTGMVVVVALTYLATLVLFGGDMNAPPTGPYLAFNVAYSFGAAVLAGWLAARLAGSRPLMHAAGVAALMLILSSGGGGGPDAHVPGWYGPALTVLGPCGALLGGWMRGRSAQTAASTGAG